MILSKYTKLNRALSFSHIKPIKRQREKKKDETTGNRIKLTKVKTITTYYFDMTI